MDPEEKMTAEALQAVVDPALLRRWTEACLGHESFWHSTPAWAMSAGRRQVADELVVWSERSLFTVSSAATALAVHFDGTFTLADMVDDVVAAIDLPVHAARHLVATVGLELHGRGALTGVTVPDPPKAEVVDDRPTPHDEGVEPKVGESFRLDPITGAEHRVVTEVGSDGQVMSTEYLPDGRRIVTTTITIGGDDYDALAAAQAVAGDRSLAELVPIDSCLGSKLRNDDAVPLVTIRCADGRLRSVRCHHPAVAEALRERAGGQLELTDARGPIEAFVVTPLEGHGPVRIFDGRGRRRGRPRTVVQAVDVVDQILGECMTATPNNGDSSDVLVLPFQLLGAPDGSGVLVPPKALEDYGIVARLTRQGWTSTWGDAEVTHRGVRAPSVFEQPVVAVERPEVLMPGADELTPAQRVVSILEPLSGAESVGTARSEAIDRGRLVDLAVRLVEASVWRSLVSSLDDHLLAETPMTRPAT